MVTVLGVFLLAVGAVLTFAVDASVPGIDVSLVGALLMVVGATGVAMSMMRLTPHRRVHAAPYRLSPVVPRTVRP
jgi:Domain of unknown function (DUF6458)